MRFLIFMLVFIHAAIASDRYTGWDGIVPDDWNFAHGLFLKRSIIITNACYNGNYGSIDEDDARGLSRQSIFKNYKGNNYYLILENTTNHPLEPIAAFIQWCYTTPSRVSLNANTDINDPMGIWARHVNNPDPGIKEQALKVMGKFMSLIDELYRFKNFDDFNRENFCAQFIRLFDSDAVKQSDNRMLAEIIFSAVDSDVNNINLRTFYPANMVRRTLLSYITDIISDRRDLAEIYKAAHFLKPDFAIELLPNVEKETYIQIKDRLSKQSGTISDYVRILTDYPERRNDIHVGQWLHFDDKNKLHDDAVFRSCIKGVELSSPWFAQILYNDAEYIMSQPFVKDILSGSELGRTSQAILFRMFNTFVINLFAKQQQVNSSPDYQATVIKHVLDRITHIYQKSPDEIIKTTTANLVEHNFWQQYCLPNVLGYEDTYTNAIINYLKNTDQYQNYVDHMMKSAHPEKWRLAAFLGLNHYFTDLRTALDNIAHPDYNLAKSIFDGPMTGRHPIIAAVAGRQSEVFQTLTNNGKADYWKTNISTAMPDRTLAMAIFANNTVPIFDLVLANDPNFSLLPNGQAILPQIILSKLNDVATFEFLRGKFNLSKNDLINWHCPYYREQTSLLDIMLDGLMVNKYPLISHLSQQYPEIIVTDQTMRHLCDEAICESHESTPDTARLLISRYKGNFDFLNFESRIPGVSILHLMLNSQGCLWLFDTVAPALPKDLQVDGLPIILHHNHMPYQLWRLLKHGFSQQLQCNNGLSVQENLLQDPVNHVTLWMSGYDVGARPTKHAIEHVRDDLNIKILGSIHINNNKAFYKDFIQDLIHLETRLGHN